MIIKKKYFICFVILIMCMAFDKKKIYLFLLFFVFGCVLFNFILPYLGNEGNQTKRNTFDVIIVLGAPASEDCSPSSIMIQRVNKGLELLNRSFAPKIIFTGSFVANNCVEADIMSEYAISKGVKDSIIFVEPKARNTYQNAYFSVEIMKRNKFKSAAIVTSEFHKKRASAIFSNYNIEYRLFECDNPPIGIDYLFLKIRENFILSYHTLMGYPPKFGIY